MAGYSLNSPTGKKTYLHIGKSPRSLGFVPEHRGSQEPYAFVHNSFMIPFDLLPKDFVPSLQKGVQEYKKVRVNIIKYISSLYMR